MIRLIITSCTKHIAHREACRRTWLASGASYAFAVGGEPPPNPEPDVCYTGTSDIYDALPAKVREAIIQSLQVPGWKWLVKCDDDTYMHLPRLREYLSSLPPEVLAVGSRGDKEEDFTSAYGGAGYALRRSIVEQICTNHSNGTLPLPDIGAEDACITVALHTCGTTWAYTPHLHQTLPPLTQDILTTAISLHPLSPEGLYGVHALMHPNSSQPQLNYDMFAIIPAKLHSTSCPGKNGRRIGGLTLIEQAICYARQEGVHPIVATPDGVVAALAHKYDVPICYEPENTKDGDTLSLCRRVMREMENCLYFCILQPSSPFRAPGLLASIWRHLRISEKPTAYYTAKRCKLQGMITNGQETHMLNAPRRQINNNWVWPADGNIFAWHRDVVPQEGEEFLTPDWQIIETGHPLTHIDIDTEEDFAFAEQMAETEIGKKYLPARMGIKIAIISNNQLWDKDYSQEIDNDYDLVVRINDLRSIDTHCTGKRTDIAYILPGTNYLENPTETQHGDALQKAQRVIFARQVINAEESFGRMVQVFLRHKLPENWCAVEDGTVALANAKTTLYEAAWHITREYPGCELTIYGDRHAGTRALEHAGSIGQPEDFMMEELTRQYNIRWVEPMQNLHKFASI